MKKTLSILLILTLIILPSCRKTESDVISCYADTSTDAETAAPESEESESAETEIEPAETEEPEEAVIVLGDDPVETEPDVQIQPPAEENPGPGETAAQTDDGVIRMMIPTGYAEIHRALKNAEWFGMPYDEAVEAEIAETGAEMPVPEAEIVYDTAEEAIVEESGKVYTAEELYSKTNTQLADIDEGDIVKTDGEYIYILKDSEELVILSADGDNTKVLSRTTVAVDYEYCDWDWGGNVILGELENEAAKELYISGDRLGIVRTYYNWLRATDREENITYLDIFDVSDPADPVITASLGQDGTYAASRMVGDTVWLITRHGLSIDDIAEPLDTESYIPGLFDSYTQTLIPENCIVYPETIENTVYTVISSYDLSGGGRVDSKALLGVPADTIYMNGSHIYLADGEYFSETSEPYTEGVYTVTEGTRGQRTKIVKLDITDGIRTTAMTVIPGSLLNQFAMDEYNGNLRVVTSLNQQTSRTYVDETWGFRNTVWIEQNRANALYILDDELEIIGRIENLAPDETVKSVRFSGETGYFVTFRQVDPLFTADLSNPAEPVIMSELKIPGFSQYLHPYADGLLFGLGQDADETTGRTTGLKLSMFNTADHHNVTEQHKLNLDYGWSAALNNHKAILVSQSRDLIGFPADNGYAVYGYNPDGGFYQKAFIERVDGNWDGLTRGLFVGDAVYIVMQNCCTVLDMETFAVLTAVKY